MNQKEKESEMASSSIADDDAIISTTDATRSMENNDDSSGFAVVVSTTCLICYDEIAMENNHNNNDGGGDETDTNNHVNERTESSTGANIDTTTTTTTTTSAMTMMVTVQECQHSFCRPCLREHCQHAVFARKVPVPCPCWSNRTNPCSTELSVSTVQDALTKKYHYNIMPSWPQHDDSSINKSINNNCNNVSSSCFNNDDSNTTTTTTTTYERAWQLFQRLHRLQTDPTLLSCPWCHALVEEQPTSPHEHDNDVEKGTSRRPDDARIRSCTSCRRSFCKIHGSAHPNQSCEAHLQRQKSQAFRKSEEAVKRYTLPCSHCGGRISKSAGCDHVLCPMCGQDMCYRCGTHEYLSGRVIRTCSNCQQGYVDHRHEGTYRCWVLLSLPLVFPSFVLYMVLVTILGVATVGFCGCFGLGRCLPPPEHHQVLQPDWVRGLSLGFSLLAMPITITLRDLGRTRCRMPHEIFLGLRAGANPSTSPGRPEIPHLHVPNTTTTTTTSGESSLTALDPTTHAEDSESSAV